MNQSVTPVVGFISIHALHEESDQILTQLQTQIRISIHALHEESDAPNMQVRRTGSISIHALHEESDGFTQSGSISNTYFNPRSP